MKRMMVACCLLFAFSFITTAQDRETTQGKEESAGQQEQLDATSEFVQMAASGGMMEVRLGKLAKEKASSKSVKDFGAMMVKDHSKANDELKAVAKKNRISVPADMMEDHMEHVNELSKMSGTEFDKEYIDMMVEDHENDIAMFEDAAEDEEINADIKGFAAKTLPTLKQHLQKAQQIQKGMDSMTRENNNDKTE